ncbi:MAG TPA: hypothetical protein VFE22_11520 [Edaphobacter sp.]|nr:hypothetical protein [Edaphobacter sp.]
MSFPKGICVSPEPQDRIQKQNRSSFVQGTASAAPQLPEKQRVFTLLNRGNPPKHPAHPRTRRSRDFGLDSGRNEPKTAQNREKPEKTCGNPTNRIDKVCGKAEGELRYGSPHPHEH